MPTPIDRELKHGLRLQVQALSNGGRIILGQAGSTVVDEMWEYDSFSAARDAADRWDPLIEPEPTGWTKRGGSFQVHVSRERVESASGR